MLQYVTHTLKGGNMSNEAAIEQQIQSKGLTARRIKPEHIDNTIANAQYHVFPGTTTTVCFLTLQNGFTTVGHSACVSPENFDKEIGRQIAYHNAREQIWQLEGYLLRESIQ